MSSTDIRNFFPPQARLLAGEAAVHPRPPAVFSSGSGLVRAALQREVCGGDRGAGCALAFARHKFSRYQLLGRYLPSPVEIGRPLSHRPYVSSLSIHPQNGESLAASSSDGRVSIHDIRSVHERATLNCNYNNWHNQQCFLRREESTVDVAVDAVSEKWQAKYQPLLLAPPMVTVTTGKRVERLSWNPAHSTTLLCCYSNCADVHSFDLAAYNGVKPTAVYTSQEGAQGGLHDVAFFPGQPQRIVAGGLDGSCKLWDLRRRGPWKVIRNLQAGVIHCVQVAPNGMFFVGTESGHILAWDLRDLDRTLLSFDVRSLLATHAEELALHGAQPGVSVGISTAAATSSDAQTVARNRTPADVPWSVSLSSRPHPVVSLSCTSESRLAFQSRRGHLVGVVDLISRRVVGNVFTPEETGGLHSDVNHPRLEWARNGEIFVVPTPASEVILCELGENSVNEPVGKWPARAPLVCSAFHQFSDYLFCGLADNSLAVAGVS